ncbi:MAG: ABC transporter ATP-binding protein [Candidatus Dormibacteraceae bacterium]
MNTPAITVQGLIKRYGRQVAVNDLSFEVGEGSVAGILGPNGAGKTTTVECCEGYRRPDRGRINILGLDPWRQGSRLKPKIGVMLQGGGIYPSVRAAEMMRHMARLYAHPISPGELIERLSLQLVADTPFRRLSGGQQQRLSLALAIIGRPELVFLDEPTAGLDPQGRIAAWELIEELREAGVTVLLTTHSMDEAERLADQILIVDRGRIVASGSVEQLTAGRGSEITFTTVVPLDLIELGNQLPGGCSVAEPAPRHYAIRGSVGPAEIAQVISWCAANKVVPEGLRVSGRTLEDVYLEVTGREQRDD